MHVRSHLCALSLALSLFGLASTASAQRADTFDSMRAGFNAASGRPANSPASAGLRVTAEVLAGGAVGAAAGGVGLLAGGLWCGFDALDTLTVGQPSSACHGRLPTAMFGTAFAAASIGSAFGVTVMGDRMGGQGAWWGASLGTLAGSALGVAIVSQTELDWRLSSLIFLGAATAGSVVGYELSGGLNASPAVAPRAARRVSPVAVATPDGAQVGVVGTF